MPTREEIAAENAAVRAVLDSGVEARLRAIPGVIHVSVGLKQRAGIHSDLLCIRVYVEEKRALADIPEAERIPAEINGVETDVLTTRTFNFSLDTTRYRPIKGGISVTNRIIDLNKLGTDTVMTVGTLGCIATHNKSAVILSNCHVLKAHNAEKGDWIFQPAVEVFDPVPVSEAPKYPSGHDDGIAKIVFGFMSEDVDGAIARIDVSSCCHCCGVDYTNEIVGLSRRDIPGVPPDDLPATNTIVGMRPALAKSRVFIVGAVTGRSEGWITDANGPDITMNWEGASKKFINQIYISAKDPLRSFSAEGDSGSVIIDEENYIVGLLFASSNDAPEYYGAANHIEHVCSGLDIKINFTKASTPTSGVRTEWRMPHLASEHDPLELYAIARERVLAHPAGAWLWEIADTHRDEIVRLVTTHRPVSVAWQRAAGPAFFAAALNTLRAGRFDFPMSVNGVALEDALARMGVALEAHGSPELRDAVRTHREMILGSVHESQTLDDVLDKLRVAMATHE
jgi:hypothetical protein